MKSRIYYRETLLIIIILSFLTTIVTIQYQQTSNQFKTTQKKQNTITHLIKTYQTKLKQKTSIDTLIKSITNRLNGTIISNQKTKYTQHIIIQTKKSNDILIQVLNDLKNYYGPINDIAIDLLNQTIELRIPL